MHTVLLALQPQRLREGGVDAERLQGTKDRNISWATGEQGAESTSVVITNKQLSLLGAKQPLHILT